MCLTSSRRRRAIIQTVTRSWIFAASLKTRSQPCLSASECCLVRRRRPLPFFDSFRVMTSEQRLVHRSSRRALLEVSLLREYSFDLGGIGPVSLRPPTLTP